MNEGARTAAWSRYAHVVSGIPVAIDAVPTLKKEAHEPVLRGLYCVSASGLEAYFTKLATDVSFDKISQASGAELMVRVRECCSDLGISLNRSRLHRMASRGPVQGTLLRDLIHSDMTIPTFNRPAAIDGVLSWSCGSRFDSSVYWLRVAARVGFGSARDAREALDIGIERRNSIAHTGDFSIASRPRGLTPTLVFGFHTIVDSCVLEAEDLAASFRESG